MRSIEKKEWKNHGQSFIEVPCGCQNGGKGQFYEGSGRFKVRAAVNQ